MIDIQNITFSYPDQKPVFDNFSLEVHQGETWAVLGPSGCGKSTLLNLMAGLRFPSAGQITIQGESLNRPRPHTGLIIQDFGLLPWATVKQNAELGIKIRGFYGPDGTHAPTDFRPATQIKHWLERLNLTSHADKYPSQLSGGQRQRTAIARTLALEPDLILMDEPFSSLDAPSRESLQNLTLDLQKEHKLTMVIVTHTIEEAAILGRKVVVLRSPPNKRTLIFQNPLAGQEGYRDSQAYLDITRKLRTKLDEDIIPTM